MTRKSLAAVVCCILFLLLCPLSALPSIIISDGEFDPSDWESLIVYQDSGTDLGAVNTESSGGNPGAFRDMTFVWNGGPVGARRIDAFFKYTGASYNPATQGAIVSIDYAEDGRVTSDTLGPANITLPVRAALEQDDTVYMEFLYSEVQSPPFPGPWVTFSRLGIPGYVFSRVSGPGPAVPDFSVTGSEIYFGYIRANSTVHPIREITTAVDNWTVTINQTSDPAYTITKTVLNDGGFTITSAEEGDDIIYRVIVRNTSAVDITGVVVTDTLPDHLQYITATAIPAAVTVYDAGPPATLTWTIGSLAGTESTVLNLDMQILVGADQQTLTNQAEVTAIDSPAIAGQTASVDLLVGSGADLEIVAVAANEYQDLVTGDLKVRITTTVRNNGPEEAEGVVVTYDYSTAAESPVAIDTGDPIGDFMVCTDNTSLRRFTCELPSPRTFDELASVDLLVDYIKTGEMSRPDVTVSATTFDPDLSNNDWASFFVPGGSNQSGLWEIFDCFINTAGYGF